MRAAISNKGGEKGPWGGVPAIPISHRNPAGFHDGEFGFWEGASANVARMLVGRDVSKPPRVEPAEADIAREVVAAAR